MRSVETAAPSIDWTNIASWMLYRLYDVQLACLQLCSRHRSSSVAFGF